MPEPTEAPEKKPAQKTMNRKPEPAEGAAPVAAASPVDHAPAAETATLASAAVPPAPSSQTPSVASPVTITGCLEISTDGDEFRLTDTEGADVPKSRSWRSGFFKKRSTPVALVGASDPAALKKSVGKRVAVTGVRDDRELTVGSVRVISSFCK
jgi:hypothetical protein